MSATDYRRRCPHGHTHLRRLQPDHPVSTASADWRCDACRVNPNIATCHYQDAEVVNTARVEKDRVFGYVWSPSHDEDAGRGGADA